MDEPKDKHDEQRARRLLNDERGATMLEWALLLGVIGLPTWAISRSALQLLVVHYQMMTTLNGMPLP